MPEGSDGREGVRRVEALADPVPAFNLDEALARVDGDRDLLVELAGILRSEAPRMLAGIRAGLQTGDARSVEVAAHTLRGSVGSFGAVAAVQAASLLELAARSGDLSGAPGLYDSLEHAVQQLLDGLGAVWSETRCES
jgi:HPt (histidine-containing phosphotransfer) domain-containing protein